MRLYKEKIPSIASEIIHTLVKEQDIIVDSKEEAQLDVESVLEEYIRSRREITEEAKQKIKSAKLPYSNLGKIMHRIAEKRGFSFGEDGIRYISNQVLEVFMQSNNINEVFTDDYNLRKKIEPILIENMTLDKTIDAEVRKRIKNIEEGSSAWDIEYRKMEERIKKKYGLK
ncbi:MAG: DUF507 family protein [Myxococcota bacterium]